MKLKRKNNSKRKVSFEVIFFYVMTVLFCACFCFSVYNVTTYIMELVSAGSLSVMESLEDIIVYYINNCGSMLAYTVITYGMLCLIQNKENHVEVMAESIEEVNEEVQEVVEETTTEEVVEEKTEVEEVNENIEDVQA